MISLVAGVISKKTLLGVGVFPVSNHYYEPQFDFRENKHLFSEERSLPGINWNIEEQLETLKKLTFHSELANIKTIKTDDLLFHFNNGAFESGDAEFWYQLIRSKKPNRIFEI